MRIILQGRPIPVFDSERGADKGSSHLQQQVPPSVAKSHNPGDCVPGYVDPYLSKRHFKGSYSVLMPSTQLLSLTSQNITKKVLTRTVYIGGITQSITKEQLRDLFETIARVDTVTVTIMVGDC